MKWLRSILGAQPPVTAPMPVEIGLSERTAVDLFCGGAGGWGFGLHLAGVRVSVAVEANPHRRELYHARWGVPVLPDVVGLAGAAVVAAGGGARPWLLCGSPPCKGISEVNQKGKGVDDDGLFFEAIRLGLETRPDWIALENVSRLRTRGADRVLEQLELGGYACWPLVVSSLSAGKDHERRRVFIVARRSDLPDPQGREGGLAGLSWQAPRRAPARWFDVGHPGDRRGGLGHLRAQALGRHVRAYDGVSDRVAEQARHAYGDTLDPIYPYLIAQALIAWEDDRRYGQGDGL